MEIINFNGVKGEITEKSPHGNYLVVKLNDRLTVCVTKTNIWNWEINEDQSSGFKSFITYLGFNTDSVMFRLIEKVRQTEMGYFKDEKDCKRPRKRISSKRFKYEMKIRGLTAADVIELMNFK
jgi:hypothetical protein